jgi:hypothetical protein
MGHTPIHYSYRWLWRSSCQNKRKFFFWLLLKDRLNTRTILRRRNVFLENYSCAFCTLNVEEDLLHLFFHCPFAASCWFLLHLIIPNCDDLETMLDSLECQIHLPFFMEIIVTMCWSIRVVRNEAISMMCLLHFAAEERICLSFTKSKREVPPPHRSMDSFSSVILFVRSPCVTFLIFFYTFFVS